ncbi:MAG: hypothetical protein WCI55_08030 [Armatimonadota bacterium]
MSGITRDPEIEIIKHFKELLETRNIKPESKKGMSLQFWYLNGVYAATGGIPASIWICQATRRSILTDINQNNLPPAPPLMAIALKNGGIKI